MKTNNKKERKYIRLGRRSLSPRKDKMNNQNIRFGMWSLSLKKGNE
jgi:hypothetical protein